MAIITWETVSNYFKNTSDWVKGTDAVSSPKVTVSAALPAGTNNIGDVDLASSIPSGTNLIGKVGIDQTTPGTTNGVVINSSALPTGAATETKQDSLIAKDFATQTTLAALLAKVIVSPSTEAKQDTLITSTGSIATLLTNVEGTAFASAARIATVSSSDLTNSSHKGIHVVLDVTAASLTPSITLKIEGKDALSGKYYTLLASAAVTGISTNIYKIHPNLTASPNLIANDIIPKTFRVTMTHDDADSITYTVGYSLV